MILAGDIGGSSCRMVLLDAHAQVLGVGHVPAGGNPESTPAPLARANIAAAASRALAGRTPRLVQSMHVALAGPSDALDVQLLARDIDLAPSTPTFAYSDTLATFLSGSDQPNGTVLIAGTGAIAARVENGALAEISDGLGWRLGDRGSAYWIGVRVAQEAARVLLGQRKASAMTRAVLAQVSAWGTHPANAPEDLDAFLATISWLTPPVVATLARYPLANPSQADCTAVLESATSELVQTVLTLTSRPGEPLVAGGGVACRLPNLETALERAVTGSRVHIVSDGLLGACLAALHANGVAVAAVDRQSLHLAIRARWPSPESYDDLVHKKRSHP